VRRAEISESNVYVDTIVSPSYTVAISQLIQFPGISGKENNMLLFEFSKSDPSGLEDIVDNYGLAASVGFDVCVLASSERGFGYCRQIHVWLTPQDYDNASLMILLAYILLGHRDWRGAVIKIFSVLPSEHLADEKRALDELIKSGRLPISAMHVEVVPREAGGSFRELVNQRSKDADLVIVGFVGEVLEHKQEKLFHGYQDVGNVLFVNTRKDIPIAREGEEPEPADALTEGDRPRPEAEPKEERASSGEGEPEPSRPRGRKPPGGAGGG
jgi:hypothetical protein